MQDLQDVQSLGCDETNIPHQPLMVSDRSPPRRAEAAYQHAIIIRYIFQHESLQATLGRVHELAQLITLLALVPRVVRIKGYLSLDRARSCRTNPSPMPLLPPCVSARDAERKKQRTVINTTDMMGF